MYNTLLTELENGILVVTINRPDKLNALNQTVFQELNAVLDEVDSNPDIKSMLLTGAGVKAFVAGADIVEFQGLSQADAEALAARGQATFFRIEKSRKPIVAAVNGFALGGGCELAMACHFRIASDTAKFGQPEVNLGLIPGYGGTQRLTQLIGKGRAIEMLISANMIDAPTAAQWGLVNQVVGADELLPKTKAILHTIQGKAPLAVAACIELANQAATGDAQGFEDEVKAFGHCFQTEDAKEGTTAFLEKRKAQFQGK
jgi:enoyl-CoA hydratase